MSNIVSILSSMLGFFHLVLSSSSLYFREYRYCYSDIRDSLSLSLSLRGALIKIFVKKTVLRWGGMLPSSFEQGELFLYPDSRRILRRRFP